MEVTGSEGEKEEKYRKVRRRENAGAPPARVDSPVLREPLRAHVRVLAGAGAHRMLSTAMAKPATLHSCSGGRSSSSRVPRRIGGRSIPAQRLSSALAASLAAAWAASSCSCGGCGGSLGRLGLAQSCLSRRPLALRRRFSANLPSGEKSKKVG
jgi:hypothetical protein